MKHPCLFFALCRRGFFRLKKQSLVGRERAGAEADAGLTALLMGAKSVFTAEEWKSGLETRNSISGVVLGFEIFGPLVFKLLLANRGVSCVRQHRRIATSPCV